MTIETRSRPVILLTEDEAVLRQMLEDVLRFRGFDVAVAADGVECLERVPEVRPDIVILDIMMPRRDGYETAALLRENPTTADLPILALTALATADVHDRILRAGCDLILTKPVAPDDLVHGVQVLLEKGRATHGDAGEAERFASQARDAAAELVARGADAIRDLDDASPESDTELRRRIQGIESVATCSFCGRVRGAGERWREIPDELRDYLDKWTSMSHGVCPECFAREYPGVNTGR